MPGTQKSALERAALAYGEVVMGKRGTPTVRFIAIAAFLLIGATLGISAARSSNNDAPKPAAMSGASAQKAKETPALWDGNPDHPDCSLTGHPDPKHPGDFVSDAYSDNCPTSETLSQPIPDMENAQFLSDKYGLAAAQHCADGADDYLRAVAKYDFSWDEVGMFDFKFDKTLAHVDKPGVLSLYSRKAKLQNGFGASKHVTLYCDYDTQAETAAFRIAK